MQDTTLEQQIGKPLLARGKVRDLYDLGDRLLIVVSDRISAFDVVFNEPVPQKGVILNQLAAFWFKRLESVVGHHMLSTDPTTYPDGLDRHAGVLAGRSMLVKKVDMLPVECIVRGYLEGSALKAYQAEGSVSGLRLPEGLTQGDRLPEPIFTPSTKAESGHDENISFDQLVDLIGSARAHEVRQASLAFYREAARYSEARGLLLADSKFEFGLDQGRLLVADELFTPDSSRFWDLADYQPGRPQKSFDKQYLRQWLEGLDWDKNPPPPPLPEAVIRATAARYRQAYERLTGQPVV